jgi:hypothetical protein
MTSAELDSMFGISHPNDRANETSLSLSTVEEPSEKRLIATVAVEMGDDARPNGGARPNHGDIVPGRGGAGAGRIRPSP